MTNDQLLESLVHRLSEVMGDDLVSVVLYGSAVTGDYQKKVSDLNVLCVLTRVGSKELDRVNAPVRWWLKKQKAVPIFLSREEVENAHDAFAIEFLDIRAAYRILHGEDVVSDIQVEPEHHRHQVEHELRSGLLRLRERYIASHDDRRELTRLLVESLPSTSTLLRHALILHGEESPVTKHEIFERAAERFSISTKPFEAILAFRQGNERLDDHDIHPLFGDYLSQITKAAEAVDKL